MLCIKEQGTEESGVSICELKQCGMAGRGLGNIEPAARIGISNQNLSLSTPSQKPKDIILL
jgi:hypothetical protein